MAPGGSVLGDRVCRRRGTATRSPASRRSTFLLMLVVSLLLTSIAPSAGTAQPATPPATGCLIVAEPNDQPLDAVDLGSGKACADAAHPDTSQDLYRWTVDEATATSRWTLSLSAIPGQVGLIAMYRIELDAAGTVTSSTELVSMRGERGMPTSAANLLFLPGTYYLGIATSGPGPYRLTVSRGDPLPNPVTAAGSPVAVNGAFASSGTTGDADTVLEWAIDDGASAAHLDLRVQGPVGTDLSWTLAGSQGARLYQSVVASAGTSLLPDIGLPPGNYTITLRSTIEPAVPWIISTTLGELRAADLEDEPNEDLSFARPIVFDGDTATLTGRLADYPGNDDADHFILQVDSAHAQRLTDIRLLWQGGPPRRLCLHDAAGVQLRCGEGDAGIALEDLVLTAGGYGLRVSGTPAPETPYTLRVDISGEAVDDFEAEPNDDMARASTMAPNGNGFASAGRLAHLAHLDTDYFRIPVTGEPQLWLVELIGDHTPNVELLDAAGTGIVRATAEAGGARIYDAFLVPGDHIARVTGQPGDYIITASPLGPPDPLFEREPNDAVDRSQPIALLEERAGRLATTTDIDYYRFSLQDTTRVALALELPADARVTLYLTRAANSMIQIGSVIPGEALRWSGLLPPGDYVLALRATTPSLESYRLLVTPLDPYQSPEDLEPNDLPYQAVPIPPSLQVSGTLNPQVASGDADWYLVPAFETTQVAIDYTPEVTVAMWTVGDSTSSSQLLPGVLGTEAGGMLVDVPSGQPLLLEVHGMGPYDIALSPVDDPRPIVASPVAGTEPALTASLDLGETPPAAYWTEAQVVEGTFSVTNSGNAAVEVDLAATTGHFHWDATLERETVTVAAGETAEMPIEVLIAPDAWADQPVFVAVEARDGETSASAMALVIPSRTAPPLNARRWDHLPPSMLGGLNVAWGGLGGEPITADEAAATAQAQLYDQLIHVGNGWQEPASALPIELSVDLAGDAAVPVAGIILFPRGASVDPDTFVRAFELDLSDDGQMWETVLTGELDQILIDQAFALDAPIEARFASPPYTGSSPIPPASASGRS